jgi:photosystem II stability/assembly factor-like uncharacterized protein
MKKFYYTIFASMAILIAVNSLSAQPWMDNLNKKNPNKIQGSAHNFYDIQKSFYEYWSGKDTSAKSIGWKQFKRWEWFWSQRVYPTGNFPNPDVAMKESNLFDSKYKDKKLKNQIQSQSPWTCLGPWTSPGGYAGLGRINVVRENPINADYIYIGAASGGFWYSTNAGSNWATTTDNLASIGVTDIAIPSTSPNTIYIATGDGDASDCYSIGVMKSNDGGLTWNSTGLNWTQSQTRTISRLLIDPSNSNVLYAGGNFGIYKTTDAGASWNLIFSSTSVRDMEFMPGNSATIYASGSIIYRSQNSGASWSQLTSGLPTSAQRVALGVTPGNSNYVYALMSNSSSGFMGLYRSMDGGNNWLVQSTSPNLLGWDIAGGDSGGQGWYDLAIAVDQIDPNVVYTGGVNIWKSVNGGVSWTLSGHWYGGGGAAEVHADIHDLWFVPNTNRLYAGNDGGIYQTTNSGSTWDWLGNGLNITQFYRLGASQTNPEIYIAGAQDNGTKNFVGGNWQDVIGGDGMECMIDIADNNYQYGSLYYGRILRSSDGGYNFWDWVSVSSFSGESGAWVAPYCMHPTNNQTIYIGYKNIYRTTNRGSSWTKLTNWTAKTLQLLSVDPDNASYIYASTGTDFWMSPDGGSIWNPKTLPGGLYLTYLAIKHGSPQTIYGAFSGYVGGSKVFVSNDGGTSWQNISYNLPNLPVNTVVYQKNTGRLYCGNDIAVYYLDPGQTNWVEYSVGLPNVVVNEIELQPAFSKMKIATYGRGVWDVDIFSGNAVSLVSPSNSSTLVTKTPTMNWNSINLATRYELIIADNASFTNPIVNKSNIFSTNYDVTGTETLLPNTLYYWKVRAIDDQAPGLWSNTWTFTTTPNPPDNTVLKSPDNNSTQYVKNVTLNWYNTPDALTYDLQVSTAANFSSFLVNATGMSNVNYALSNLANGKYYWRVRGVNNVATGNWSSVFNFTVDYVVPAKVVLSAPSNGANAQSLSTLLQWLASSGAITYEILVASDANFGTIVGNFNSVSSLNQAITGLTYFTTYYWKVRGIHPSNVGAWSDTWSFQTVGTPIVLNISNKRVCQGSPIELGTLDFQNNIITASGGSGNYDYSWFPPQYLINPYTGNPTFAYPQYSTTFTLTVRDLNSGAIVKGNLFVEVTDIISIDMPLYVVIKKGTTIDIDAQIRKITGGTTPYTKYWEDNYGKLVTNTVMTPPAGMKNFFVTVKDEYGCVSTRRLILIVSSYKDVISEDNISTSPQGNLSLVAFPNPATDNLSFYLISENSEMMLVQVQDLNGKVISTQSTKASEDVQTVNISQLPSGSYYLNASNGNERVIFKFIKK